jgi:hypothetical protein
MLHDFNEEIVHKMCLNKQKINITRTADKFFCCCVHFFSSLEEYNQERYYRTIDNSKFLCIKRLSKVYYEVISDMLICKVFSQSIDLKL